MVSVDEQKETRPGAQQAWIGYALPMALFIVLTFLEGYRPAQYVWIYIAKVIIVSASLIVFRETWKDYRLDGRVLIPALLVGLFVFVEWIPVDHLLDKLHLHFGAGKRAALDPFTSIHDPALRWLFLGFRFFGLALMVPFMEELFWRSFLLRFISEPDGDFRTLPQGKFTWAAFALVAAAFGLSHPEWLSAAICAITYGLLLWKTRNLFAPFVAHSVTNLILGIYIIHTHQWAYW